MCPLCWLVLVFPTLLITLSPDQDLEGMEIRAKPGLAASEVFTGFKQCPPDSSLFPCPVQFAKERQFHMIKAQVFGTQCVSGDHLALWWPSRPPHPRHPASVWRTFAFCTSLLYSFRRQVLWKLMAAVKLGDTVSYQQLAALVGKSGAARAVGGAMRDNPCPDARPRDMQKEACAQKLNEAWLMKYQPHMKAATRHCHGDRSNGAGYRRAKGLSLSSKGAAAHSLEDTHVHPYC
ncbi:methylated-DNA--protein-cysteine methyltransferase isoform X1 [Phascolarctos cinereus]